LASVALKASVCLFLLRITILKLHIWILYSVMTVTVITGLVFMLVLLLQCHPISYFWDKTQPGHCIDWNVIIAMSWLWSVFAAMCDFTVGILPIFLVKNLKMDRRTKFAVVGILGVACMQVSPTTLIFGTDTLTLNSASSAGSAVIIRMPFLHTFGDPDFLCTSPSVSECFYFSHVLTMVCPVLGATTDIALWANIEVGLGIFASCLAALRPLLRAVLGKSRPYISAHYQNSDRLRSNDLHSSPFKRNFPEQIADPARKFRPQNKDITLTTVHSMAGAYDRNGSDDHLNQLPQIQNPKQEYLVQKTFEVTATESVPLENI
jgi:hypothetical protein